MMMIVCFLDQSIFYAIRFTEKYDIHDQHNKLQRYRYKKVKLRTKISFHFWVSKISEFWAAKRNQGNVLINIQIKS